MLWSSSYSQWFKKKKKLLKNNNNVVPYHQSMWTCLQTQRIGTGDDHFRSVILTYKVINTFWFRLTSTRRLQLNM